MALCGSCMVYPKETIAVLTCGHSSNKWIWTNIYKKQTKNRDTFLKQENPKPSPSPYLHPSLHLHLRHSEGVDLWLVGLVQMTLGMFPRRDYDQFESVTWFSVDFENPKKERMACHTMLLLDFLFWWVGLGRGCFFVLFFFQDGLNLLQFFLVSNFKMFFEIGEKRSSSWKQQTDVGGFDAWSNKQKFLIPGPSTRSATWMGVGVPLSNPLGFKHHPLEGAIFFIVLLWIHIPTVVVWSLSLFVGSLAEEWW